MRTETTRGAVISSFFVGLAVSAVHGDILVNGGFEAQPNFGSGVAGDAGFSALTGSQLPGWTIEPGRAATIHNTVLYPTISGGFSLNTDGEGFGGNNTNIFQDFSAQAGIIHQFSFDWQNWFTSTAPRLDVSIVDTVTLAVLVQGNFGISPGLHHETFQFAGTGNTLRLRVQHLPQSGFNDNTFIVDNFDVIVVPAPAGVMAAAPLALMFAGRRRRGR